MLQVNRHRKIPLLFAFALLFSLTGCKTKGRTKTGEAPPFANATAHVEKLGPGEGIPPEPWDPNGFEDIEPPERLEPGPGGASHISEVDNTYEYSVVDRVHFDYDSDLIKSEWVHPLQNNARWMKDHPSYFMIIEGHCDERGTNEYNLALGERRAASVRKFLIQEGVDADRVQVKSYGEEQPLDPGHDESAWYQNRRAEFLVSQP